jgi:hypothetical protein
MDLLDAAAPLPALIPRAQSQGGLAGFVLVKFCLLFIDF